MKTLYKRISPVSANGSTRTMHLCPLLSSTLSPHFPICVSLSLANKGTKNFLKIERVIKHLLIVNMQILISYMVAIYNIYATQDYMHSRTCTVVQYTSITILYYIV